jgi:hypothetical protein
VFLCLLPHNEALALVKAAVLEVQVVALMDSVLLHLDFQEVPLVVVVAVQEVPLVVVEVLLEDADDKNLNIVIIAF